MQSISRFSKTLEKYKASIGHSSSSSSSSSFFPPKKRKRSVKEQDYNNDEVVEHNVAVVDEEIEEVDFSTEVEEEAVVEEIVNYNTNSLENNITDDFVSLSDFVEPSEQEGTYLENMKSYEDVTNEIGKFNVMNEIMKLIPLHDNSTPLDDSSMIHASLRSTKGEFCRNFEEFSINHSLTNIGRKELWDLFEAFSPKDALFPEKDGDKGNATKYLPYYNMELIFDCCSEGHCVYVNELKDSTKCPYCNEFRYRPCTVPLCTRIYDGGCLHAAKRIPQCTLFYRPITNFIISCLKYNDSFLELLACVDADAEDQDHLITDCNNASNAKESMAEMKAIFEQLHNKDNIIAVCLLLSIFYDGAQIYRHSELDNNFIVCMICFLNLPPAVRNKKGVGTFMPFLFTNEKKSAAENFIFKNCLIAELTELAKGILVEVHGKQYFIQCRLIMHLYDTKELEPMLQVQATNTKTSTPFNRSIIGDNKEGMLHSVVYMNFRKYLCYNHSLRTIGQSLQCCPCSKEERVKTLRNVKTLFEFEQQEKKNKAAKELLEQKLLEETLEKDQTKKTEKKKPEKKKTPENYTPTVSKSIVNNEEAINKLQPCDKEKEEDIKTALRNNSFVWYNENSFNRTDFPYLKYKNIKDKTAYDVLRYHLYYDCVNYEKEEKYTRISHETFRDEAMEAEQDNTIVNGIKGASLFLLLFYFRIDHCKFEPFHSLKNNAHAIFALLQAKAADFNAKTIDYCRAFGFHPCVSDPLEKDIGWFIMNELQGIIEIWFKGIIVPKGFREHFKAPAVFNRLGKTKSHDIILTICSLIHVMIYCIMKTKPNTYPASYAVYLLTLSDLYSSLLAPEFDKNSLDELENKVFEFLSIHEGAFPHSECKPALCQLTDIVASIKLHGPLHSSWAFPGERTFKSLKDKLPDGGTNFAKTVKGRCTDQELHSTYKFYHNLDTKTCLSSNIDDVKEDSSSQLSSKFFYKNENANEDNDGKSKTKQKNNLYFTTQNFFFYNSKTFRGSTMWRNTDIYLEEIYEVLLMEIKKYCDGSDDKDPKVYSNLYRLYALYSTEKVFKKGKFTDWLNERKTSPDTPNKEKNIIEELLNISYRYYEKGVVYGTKFSARKDHIPLHTWTKLWADPTQRSSWCRFKKFKKDSLTNSKSIPEDSCGLINYFVRVDLPSEPLLHGLPVANITHYTTKRIGGLHEVNLSPYGNKSDIKVIFVAATQMFASTIGILGLREPKNDKGISMCWQAYVMGNLKRKINKDTLHQCRGYFSNNIENFNGAKSSLQLLVLIDLERHKLKLSYCKTKIKLYNKFEP